MLRTTPKGLTVCLSDVQGTADFRPQHLCSSTGVFLLFFTPALRYNETTEQIEAVITRSHY